MTTVTGAAGRRTGGAPQLVLAAVAAAWALALVAQLTGAGERLHHDELIVGGPPLWLGLLTFLIAWQAMVAAMMIPSSLPLIRLYDAVSRSRPGHGRAMAAFLGGYAAVWTAFGALALLGDVAVHRAVDSVPWLSERPWLVSGGVLVLAGAFEFSSLKEKCLTTCRHPAPYLMSRYRRGAGAGFRLGAGHGLFCLGCCWALMLVMFAAGVAVLWWMAALTLVMVYEKTGRHGRALSPVVGVTLLVLGTLTLVHPGWLPNPIGS